MKRAFLHLFNLKTSHKLAIIVFLLSFIWVFSGVLIEREHYDTRTVALRQAEKTQSLQTVRVKKVTSEDMMQNISLSGKTVSFRTVILKAEASGRVKSIDFEKGMFASKDTTIVSLEIDNRQSLLDRAKANLKEKEIAYNAKIKLQEQQLSSSSAVSAAKSGLEQAKSDVKIAELNLQHTKITAPFDGFIDDRFVEIGDYISIGQKIATIVDLNPIKAVGYISENFRPYVKTGSDVMVSFSHDLGSDVKGKISYIASSSDESTRTYKFEVSIPNKDNVIKEGETCSIKIDIATKTAHSISPSLIVLNDKGIIGVRAVDKNNIVKFLPVEVLTDENEQIWLAGLPAEFTLITVGQEYVKDGVEVEPIYEEEE